MQTKFTSLLFGLFSAKQKYLFWSQGLFLGAGMYIQGVLFPLADEFAGAKIAGYFSPAFPCGPHGFIRQLPK
jgi:hypothetical protein